MRRILIALALAASPAFAHGGGPHLKGIVTAVSSDHITVKADGHETTATVTDKTQFVRGNARAKVSDVKEGERVVVHTRKEGGGLEAVGVHLGAQHAKLTF